jgi:hypothetical protein
MNAWAGAWARATWVPAGRRATPVWLGVATMAAVLFGPNGMRPHDLTLVMRDAPAVGAVIVAAWLLLIAPVGRSLFRSPGTAFLRSLPAPRGARWAIAGLGAIVAQLPWTILWGKGEGAVAAVIATAAAAGVTIVVGIVPGPAPRVRVPRWRRRWWAVAAVLTRGVIRTAGASLVRGIGLALLAGATAGAMVRINALTGDAAVSYAAGIDAVLLSIALAGSIAAVADADLRLDWFARANGLAVARAGAIAVVLGSIGAGLGAIAGLTAAALGDADATTTAAVAGAAIAVGLGLGLTGARIATLSRRGDGVDGGRLVAAIGGVGFAAVAAIGALGAVGLVVIVAAGAAGAATNLDAIVRAARVER